MNKPFFISISLCLVVVNSNAQGNLVPNPSFEVTDSCSEFYSFLQYGFGGWFVPTPGTTDMYNGCVTNDPNADVPNNYVGWQNARTGTGYAGLISYETAIDNPDVYDAREYIEIRLKVPLLSERQYQASYYVSRADSYSVCSSNMLGMYFTVDSLYSTIPWGLFNYPAQIESIEIVQDSIGWTKIEGSFFADGGEEYLTLGSFRHDNELSVICEPEDVYPHSVYYYVDDVSVKLIPLIFEATIPNIFTPNGDQLNDVFVVNIKGYVASSISIFNRWGNLVYAIENSSIEWNGSSSSEGVYYYILKLTKEDRSIDIKKGYVQLIR